MIRRTFLTIGLAAALLDHERRRRRPHTPRPHRRRLPPPQRLDHHAGRQTVPLTDLPLNIVPLADGKHALVATSGFNKHELSVVDLESLKVVDQQTVRQSWFGLAVSPEQDRVWWSGGGAAMLHTYDLKDLKLTPTSPAEPAPVRPKDAADAPSPRTATPRNPRTKSRPRGRPSAAAFSSTPRGGRSTPSTSTRRRSPRPGSTTTRRRTSRRAASGPTTWCSAATAPALRLRLGRAGRPRRRSADLARHRQNPRRRAPQPDGPAPDRRPPVRRLRLQQHRLRHRPQRGVVTETIAHLAVPARAGGQHARRPGRRARRQDPLRRQRRQQLRRRHRRCGAGEEPGPRLHPHRMVSHRRRRHARRQKPAGRRRQGQPDEAEPDRQGHKDEAGRAPTKPHGCRSPTSATLSGALSIVPVPDDKQLAEYTDNGLPQLPVFRQAADRASDTRKTAIPTNVGDPSPIKHVIYIIKENRTYDQVFGDLKQGNGDRRW